MRLRRCTNALSNRKKIALNVAEKLKLSFFGQVEANGDQHLSESRKLIAACYGAKSKSSSKSSLIYPVLRIIY